MQVRSKVLAGIFELETLRTSLCTNTGQENCSRGHIAHLHGSAQYLQHGGLLWDTPPRDLHSIYNYICVSEVRETWDFIILNKGPITPPWRKKAQGSHAQHRVQNFSPILFPSRARGQVLGCAKNCIASKCTFSSVNVIIFESYLDLHLSVGAL